MRPAGKEGPNPQGGGEEVANTISGWPRSDSTGQSTRERTASSTATHPLLPPLLRQRRPPKPRQPPAPGGRRVRGVASYRPQCAAPRTTWFCTDKVGSFSLLGAAVFPFSGPCLVWNFSLWVGKRTKREVEHTSWRGFHAHGIYALVIAWHADELSDDGSVTQTVREPARLRHRALFAAAIGSHRGFSSGNFNAPMTDADSGHRVCTRNALRDAEPQPNTHAADHTYCTL